MDVQLDRSRASQVGQVLDRKHTLCEN